MVLLLSSPVLLLSCLEWVSGVGSAEVGGSDAVVKVERSSRGRTTLGFFVSRLKKEVMWL